MPCWSCLSSCVHFVLALPLQARAWLAGAFWQLIALPSVCAMLIPACFVWIAGLCDSMLSISIWSATVSPCLLFLGIALVLAPEK